jgi:hypothetical protein
MEVCSQLHITYIAQPQCLIVDFSHMFLLGILIFKGLTVRRLYKSFGIKGLKLNSQRPVSTDLSAKHTSFV